MTKTKDKAAPLSKIVVRAKINNAIVHIADSAIEATRWMERKNCPIDQYTITKSYTGYAAYYNRQRKTWFPPEFKCEGNEFATVVDELTRWCHAAWEQDRENHPSPAGRQEVWERWHDVIALLNIASLSTVRNPDFRYRFGPLSPPEGKGHELRIGVIPTPLAELERVKWL